MARPNKIWYWKARKCWFVTIDGQRHKLSPNKKEAENLFYKLKVQEPEERALPTDSVAAIFDDFLGWTAENRAPNTYECYRGFCQSFIEEANSLLISDLSTEHVTAWLQKKKSWNSTTKRDAITCIQRAFNWATRNRGLKYNPITGMEKPKAKTRTAFVETAEFDELLAVIPDEEFRDLLIVSWECGCRPQEVKGLEARHVDLDKSRWVFPTQEGKGERLRVVYMTEKALAIVKRLVKTHPKGPIFRNTIGNAWTGCAVKSRFEKIQVYLAELEMKRQEIESTVTDDAVNVLAAKLPKNKSDRTTGEMVPKKAWELRTEARRKLRIEEAKQYAKRFRQYDFRHTWITRKLIAGVDSHIVAALSGHSDTKMIDRVYSHVAEDHEFMLKQARMEVSVGDASSEKTSSSSASRSRSGKKKKGTTASRPQKSVGSRRSDGR